jgi:serine/threonine-protein kinase
VPPDHVIGTDPAANSSVSAGDVVTINVSTGPEQREVPDVKGMSQADAIKRLQAAGFGSITPTTATSSASDNGKVIGTVPPANQPSAITNSITLVVGGGPGTAIVPDVKDQTVDVAQQILTASGFLTTVPVPTDSTEPSGQLTGTNPPAGQTVSKDTPIQLLVSKGDQFTMPNLVGQFWIDAEPNLRTLGWTGSLVKGANVDNSGQRSNAVVTQNPAPGTAVNFTSPITISFAS